MAGMLGPVPLERGPGGLEWKEKEAIMNGHLLTPNSEAGVVKVMKLRLPLLTPEHACTNSAVTATGTKVRPLGTARIRKTRVLLLESLI